MSAAVMAKTFSRPGKIMEFEKRPKAWNFKTNHGKTSLNFVSGYLCSAAIFQTI